MPVFHLLHNSSIFSIKARSYSHIYVLGKSIPIHSLKWYNSHCFFRMNSLYSPITHLLLHARFFSIYSIAKRTTYFFFNFPSKYQATEIWTNIFTYFPLITSPYNFPNNWQYSYIYVSHTSMDPPLLVKEHMHVTPVLTSLKPVLHSSLLINTLAL